MENKRTLKFVGVEQGKLTPKWLLKFDLYKDTIKGGMMRTPPQYDTEVEANEAGMRIETEYNSTGILPNLFKMF